MADSTKPTNPPTPTPEKKKRKEKPEKEGAINLNKKHK